MNKDTRKLIAAAVKRGWTAARGGKHYHLHHPSGARVIVSGTSSDWRAVLNAIKDIERVEKNAA